MIVYKNYYFIIELCWKLKQNSQNKIFIFILKCKVFTVYFRGMNLEE